VFGRVVALHSRALPIEIAVGLNSLEVCAHHRLPRGHGHMDTTVIGQSKIAIRQDPTDAGDPATGRRLRSAVQLAARGPVALTGHAKSGWRFALSLGQRLALPAPRLGTSIPAALRPAGYLHLGVRAAMLATPEVQPRSSDAALLTNRRGRTMSPQSCCCVAGALAADEPESSEPRWRRQAHLRALLAAQLTP